METPGGDFFVGGYFTSPAAGLVKLNSGGTQVGGFSIGTGFFDSGVPGVRVEDLELNSDGNVFVGGLNDTFNGAASEAMVLLDAASGILVTEYAFSHAAPPVVIHSIKLTGNNEILVGGYFDTYTKSAVPYSYQNVIRLLSDGTPVGAFSNGNSYTGGFEYVYDVAELPNGRIAVGGDFADVNANTNYVSFVILNADGTVYGGYTGGDLNAGNFDFVNTILVQPDGDLWLGGQFVSWNATTVNNVVKIDQAGALLSTGTGATGGGLQVFSLALLSDDNVAIAGNFTTYDGTGSRTNLVVVNNTVNAVAGVVVTTTPNANQINVPVNANIAFNLSDPVDGGSLTSANVIVSGSISGIMAGSFSGGGTPNISFDPTNDFKPGELVTVRVISGLQSSSFVPFEPYIIQFTVTVGGTSLNNFVSQQSLTSTSGNQYDAVAGDFDNDGDADIITASWISLPHLYINDGTGNFNAIGQTFGVTGRYRGVVTADFNNDGYLDVLYRQIS